jgi:threonine dehydratase
MSSRTLGARLKAELFQRTGSYKARGALNKVSALADDEKRRGVITISAGNHAQATAYAAAAEGIDALVVMWKTASPQKIEATRAYGATIDLESDDPTQAFDRLHELVEQTGRTLIHPFDDPVVIAGAGTVGLEIEEDAPDADAVVVPVGGGGLIAGVAAAFAGTARVIGVEPEGAPTLTRARAQGRPADAPAGSVAADALAPRRVGELVFPITQRYVQDVVLVDDASILAAQQALWQALRIAAEPAASVGIAALLSGAYKPAPGEHVAVVISGANMTPSALGD